MGVISVDLAVSHLALKILNVNLCSLPLPHPQPPPTPSTGPSLNSLKMASDDSSELSSLSSLSPVVSEDESGVQLKRQNGILRFFHPVSAKAAQPKGKAGSSREPDATPRAPSPKRPASPPHEYVLADNPDIAVGALPRVFGPCSAPRRALGRC